MAPPEQRSKDRQTEPKTPGNRLTRTGLSPTVEKMFGALVEKVDEANKVTSPEPEAPRPKQPGAA